MIYNLVLLYLLLYKSDLVPYTEALSKCAFMLTPPGALEQIINVRSDTALNDSLE